MRRTMRLCTGAAIRILIPLGSQGTAVSEERSQFVDTGVILSLSSEEGPALGVSSPFWTPSPEQIAQLEVQLKPYLDASHQGKWIAELGIYKRQYLGYTDGGKKWIFVNSFCERFWKMEDSWRDRLVIVFDGGPCFHNVRYDPSSGQLDQLQINGPWRF
jgi:hypothetical protein